jgi:demethylmenaquinone methyltransferase / 2-methoxy-6-polyprenyl-1,4-benzoquinol methylase
MAKKQETTHFGYKQVDVNEKADKVADVFHSVAKKYDVMNDLMSFGIHRLWKRFTLDNSGVRKGHTVLDLAGGTGDLAEKFSKIVGEKGRVILSDINPSMLSVAQDRLIDKGFVDEIEFVEANAEDLPFDSELFDCVTIAFGLRNVTNKEAALAEMYRVTKPGGRSMILEFSKPKSDLMNKAYDFYSFNILPKMGKFVANDEESYQYLAESIRMHPDQETLKTMMQDAGFDEVEYHNLTDGVVALHIGYKN